MRDLCLAYMDRHGNAKKSRDEDQRRINAYVLPKWGSLTARAITRPDVETFAARSVHGSRSPVIPCT